VGRNLHRHLGRNGDGAWRPHLTAGTATQKEAAKTLYSFGAAKVMMLDGGGSTQLVCGGQAYRYTERALPQALGVSAAPPGGLEAASLLASSAASAQPAAEPVEGVTVVVASGTAVEVGGGEFATDGTDLADLHGSVVEGDGEAGGGQLAADGTMLQGSSMEPASVEAASLEAGAGQAQAPVEGVAMVVGMAVAPKVWPSSPRQWLLPSPGGPGQTRSSS
jgi:hypothetical protein